MTTEEYKQLLILSIYGELSGDERAKLERFVKTHPELKSELKELEQFKSIVSDNTPDIVSDELLHAARLQLRTALRKERLQQSLVSKIGLTVQQFFQQPLKLALGGLGMLGIGIIVGYYAFSSAGIKTEPVLQSVTDLIKNEVPSPRETKTEAISETRISNVKFIDADASDGIVEFEFEAVAPMHLKGKIDDPEIQKILTYALVNETNDGVRLRTINAIAQQENSKKPADPSVKSALISALERDQNPGVRREALRVLQQYAFENDIRDAILFVLSHDSNSGMRVAAINALGLEKIDGHKMDEKAIRELKKQIDKEQNNYIRNRAVNLVKEIYQ